MQQRQDYGKVLFEFWLLDAWLPDAWLPLWLPRAEAYLDSCRWEVASLVATVLPQSWGVISNQWIAAR